MRVSPLYYFIQLLLAAVPTTQLEVLPYGIQRKSEHQKPLVGTAMSPPTNPASQEPQVLQSGVLISDVMGRDRSINIFAGFVRDFAEISDRLDSSSQNSTVLAPVNSAIDKLPHKPWEDPRDYSSLGADAYEGDDGQDRAHRNMRRFVEAHIVPASPWPEKQKARPLLDGDKEIWWEMRDGVKVIKPDDIEVQSVASKVGNGEVWILKAVRKYT